MGRPQAQVPGQHPLAWGLTIERASGGRGRAGAAARVKWQPEAPMLEAKIGLVPGVPNQWNFLAALMSKSRVGASGNRQTNKGKWMVLASTD